MSLDRNSLIMDECGLGKTLVGAEALRRLTEGDNLPSLVICPKSVRWQWLATLFDQAPDIPREVVTVKDYVDVNRLRSGEPRVVVLHYESLVRHIENLCNVYWQVIVCDEAHRIRNRQADRSGAIKRLAARRKIALTGTPMEISPADLWSILNWLYPKRYAGYWAFFEKYAMTAPTFRNHYRVIPGCKDPDSLANELQPFARRRTRRDVAPWLPPVTETIVPLQMTQRQAELYDMIDTATDVLVDIGEDDPLFIRNGLTKVVRLQQVTSNPRLVGMAIKEVPSAKEEWVVDYIGDNPETPTIIFCQFRDTVVWLAKRLRSKGAVSILGGDKDVEDKSKSNLIVATIAAAGEGLDLPHIHTEIFVDVVWSHTKMTQAIDRIQRLSNQVPKQIIYLKVPGTIDDYVMHAFRNKWSSHELIYALVQKRHQELEDEAKVLLADPDALEP